MQVGAIITFLSAVGGNLVASILDRAAQGQQISEEELRAVLATPNELLAIRKMVEERGDLLQGLLDDIILAAQEIPLLRAESQAEHTLILRELNDIKRWLQPPPDTTDDERQQILAQYAHQLLNSQHQRMSTGGITAEAAYVEDQIREPVLDDIFVEPHLAEAGSLRESREEVARLFNLFQDEDIAPQTRDEARQQLMNLQNEAWEQIRKGGASRAASEALTDKSAVVILGDPGSGKSTLLRWLLLGQAQRLLDQESNQIPLFITIGEYARAWERECDAGHTLPLTAYLRQRAESECRGMQECVTLALQQMDAGLLLLCDGLDEVPRELRRAIVPRIQEFIQRYVGEGRPTRVVVSSRFFGYEEAPITAPAVQIVVVPFNDDQIRNFAHKWYIWLDQHLHGERANPGLAAQNAKQFEAAVFSRRQITDLARNPLLLTMIAVVIRQGRRLPERRVQLYDQALRQLMTQWEFLRMAAREDTQSEFVIDYNEACELWAPIARWMHEVGTGAVHEEELKEHLEFHLELLDREEKAEDWLTVRGDKCCLLQERGGQLFSFLHQTFQEYLAAMDLYQDGRFIDEVDRYTEDPRWHEVLRLACGHLGIICILPRRAQAATLIRRIKNHPAPYENLLHRNLLLAASCIADDVKPKRGIEQEIVEDLLQVAGSRVMPQFRQVVMEMLVENTRVQVDEALLQSVGTVLLQKQEWTMRYLFAQWLGGRSNSLTNAFLDRLCDDADPDVNCLATALSWRRNPHPELLNKVLADLPRMMSEKRPDVESVLLQETSLLAQSLYTEEPKIRLQAARLLRESELADQAVSTLIGLLTHEEGSVRLQAAGLLRGRVVKTNSEALQLLPYLTNFFTDDNPPLRQILAASLADSARESPLLVSVLIPELQKYLPESLNTIDPGDRLYEAAWLYATLNTSDALRARL